MTLVPQVGADARHLLAASREKRLVAASENQREAVVYGALECLRIAGRAIDPNTSGLARAASGCGELGLSVLENRPLVVEGHPQRDRQIHRANDERIDAIDGENLIDIGDRLGRLDQTR